MKLKLEMSIVYAGLAVACVEAVALVALTTECQEPRRPVAGKCF